eukprot:CAMPEP_0184305736 /NCGR_PEP_ID=MMETSP1049-20130417/14934_1 /TAXON_ID=77928 /ORGANISM="Proteomonas sulcata, Strain CCMP704" /LENGTH=160 /DNA_ID=CAMNT_0026617867 /DNA_START=26 /DNA_END=508 /DNA_ORIENTATION=+
MWGFNFSRVAVQLDGDNAPLAGKVKYDKEKHAYYVTLRIPLASRTPPKLQPQSPQAPSLLSQSHEPWKRLPRVKFQISITAWVPQGKGPGRASQDVCVQLEGNLTVGMVLCHHSDELGRIGAIVKHRRQMLTQSLPPYLQPLALYSSRLSARAAIMAAGN